MNRYESSRRLALSIRRRAGVLCLAVSTVVAAGCSGDPQPVANATPAPPPPASILSIEVGRQNADLERTYPARVQALNSVEVRAQVAGILQKRSYVEGQRVKAGTVLFEIDRAPHEARLQQAEAELNRAKADLRQAEREWKRSTELFKERAVSARQRDESIAARELAQAAVANAEAALRSTRIDLGYTRVVAPISGVTDLQAVAPGNLVEAGTLLTTIRQLDPVHVLFSVPEADALAQRRQFKLVGAATGKNRPKATLTLPDGSAYDSEGEIDFLAANVDPRTGTVQVRAVFDNPRGELVPGQFVRVSVQGLTLADVIVVPPRAVGEGPRGALVYLVDDKNHAQERLVQLGPRTPQGQVIAEGLEGGERVIVEGTASVRPGGPVQEREPAPAAGAGTPGERQ